MNILYVCKCCPFVTHDYKTAMAHRNRSHPVYRFTEEVL